MGAYITTFVEKKQPDGSWDLFLEPVFNGTYPDEPAMVSTPFSRKNYDMYSFLAGVRNDACIPPITTLRGIPPDVSDALLSEADAPYMSEPDYGDPGNDLCKSERFAALARSRELHSSSWLLASELLRFNYNKAFVNHETKQLESFRDFLGEEFFQDLDAIKAIGNPSEVRVVFWFEG